MEVVMDKKQAQRSEQLGSSIDPMSVFLDADKLPTTAASAASALSSRSARTACPLSDNLID
jgi:hypothetical protein